MFVHIKYCSYSYRKWVCSINCFVLDEPTVSIRKTHEERKSRVVLSRKRFEELNFFAFSKNNSKAKKSRLHHADFITIIIPFACLLSLTLLICGVSLFRSSSIMPASPSHPHLLAPNIRITEPSSIVDHKELSMDKSGGNHHLRPPK